MVWHIAKGKTWGCQKGRRMSWRFLFSSHPAELSSDIFSAEICMEMIPFQSQCLPWATEGLLMCYS